MNNFLQAAKLLILSVALLSSCSMNSDLVTQGEPSNYDGPFSISVSIPDRSKQKTYISEEVNNKFPVYWSNGDIISVNGVPSSPLSVSEPTSTAEFQVRNVVPPFNVLYPASSFSKSNTDGSIDISISDKQDYSPTSFGCGSAILYGSGESENEKIALRNLCGAVCVTLQDETAVIDSVSLTSIGEDKSISGEFNLNMTSGELIEINGTNNISLKLPQGGVALNSIGAKFFFAIPAGFYPEGFKLTFLDSRKHIQRNYWLRPSRGASKGVSIEAGELTLFEAVSYDPDAREINTEQDWAEFVQACNDGCWEEDWKGKDGTVKLNSDIAMSDFPALDEFSGILDGKGHVVRVSSGTNPLVRTLSGKLLNLTIAGSSSASSVFCNTLLEGAEISDCTNEVDIVSEASGNTFAAPFASVMTGGRIVNSANHGSILLNCTLNSSYQVTAGGIVALVPSLTNQATISNCFNDGTVTLSVIKPTGVGALFPAICGVGGIAGAVTDGDTNSYLSISNCTNASSVSADYSNQDNTVAASLSGVGGILGVAAKYSSDFKTLSVTDKVQDCIYVDIKDCSSEGTVSNECCSAISSFLPSKAYAGGIAGVVAGLSSSHSQISGCNVTGSIFGHTGTYSRAALSTVTGGLVGYGGYLDISRCVVSGSVIGSLKRQSYSSAGAIGLSMSSFKMSDCKIFATVNFIRNYVSSGDADKEKNNYSMGISLSTKAEANAGIRNSYVKLQGSEIVNCGFGGAIVYSTDIIAYNSATPTSTETLELSESDFEENFRSASLFVDGTTHTSVSCLNNYYWNGQ